MSIEKKESKKIKTKDIKPNNTNVKVIKQSNKLTKTEFNNKRFDRDNVLYNIPESKPSISNKSKKEHNDRKKIKSDIIAMNIHKDICRYEEDDIEEERSIPQPIQDKKDNSPNKKINMNEFRKLKIDNYNSNVSNPNHGNNLNKLYMPDFEASRLVDDILQNKL